MIAHSPIESNTLHDASLIDVHQYSNPWQSFNGMALTENGLPEPFDPGHAEYVH